MTKSEAVEKLKKKGYDVTSPGGIIMFRYPKSMAEKADVVFKDTKKILADIGYEASWGINYVSSTTQAESMTEGEMDAEEGERL